MHIAQLHMFFSTQILALLWNLLELWRLSFFIWLGPAYLQVVLLRSIPFSSQCREKNNDHQLSHVNRYHDIMTNDHLDQKLSISKYHHCTSNHLLTSFCWSGLVEALEGLLSQQSLKGKNCIFFSTGERLLQILQTKKGTRKVSKEVLSRWLIVV